MILLTPPFSENFDDRDNRNTSTMMNLKQARDCFDAVSLSGDCVKLYNDEYIEVFSPTVFETVEVYTSGSSERSDYADFGDANNVLSVSGGEAEVNAVDSALSLDTLDAVTSFENLEPGTYTLDVIQPTDFDFDAVFADNASTSSPNSLDLPTTTTTTTTTQDSITPQNAAADHSKIVLPKKPKGGDEGAKRPYRLKSCKNSGRKLPSPKYAAAPTRNVSAREFLNNFSNDLRRTEETLSKKPPPAAAEDEGRSLSWLLNFQISSIFNPVESDIVDTPEKVRKKGGDSQKKPRYTYTELIEQALKENGELTVSGIYSWISNHYPYYQQHDDRWKNSVRHNLSINPQFRKGKKASRGAGHFWNISDMVSQGPETHSAIINAHNIDALPRVSAESVSHRNKDTIPDSVTELIDQIDDEVLAATKSIQDSESMNFTDVSLHDAVAHQHSSSSIHISRNDIEQLWESTNKNVDHRFSSFSPLIREITEDSSNMEEENFLIEDIHNSICLGDELFSSELTSPYYGLTTI